MLILIIMATSTQGSSAQVLLGPDGGVVSVLGGMARFEQYFNYWCPVASEWYSTTGPQPRECSNSVQQCPSNWNSDIH